MRSGRRPGHVAIIIMISIMQTHAGSQAIVLAPHALRLLGLRHYAFAHHAGAHTCHGMHGPRALRFGIISTRHCPPVRSFVKWGTQTVDHQSALQMFTGPLLDSVSLTLLDRKLAFEASEEAGFPAGDMWRYHHIIADMLP